MRRHLQEIDCGSAWFLPQLVQSGIGQGDEQIEVLRRELRFHGLERAISPWLSNLAEMHRLGPVDASLSSGAAAVQHFARPVVLVLPADVGHPVARPPHESIVG